MLRTTGAVAPEGAVALGGLTVLVLPTDAFGATVRVGAGVGCFDFGSGTGGAGAGVGR